MSAVDLSGLRRLRFDYAMRPDESVIGAVANGTRAHVLATTTVPLREAGLNPKSRGAVQLASADELTRLAHVIRCDPRRLAANAGVRVGSETAQPNHWTVRFGDLEIPRSHLDLRTRRISLASLAKGHYHRLAWFNLLLPYCPESLEALVSSCGSCGATLGWKGAWGLGTCEYCLEAVVPSPEQPLPAQHADGYRLFADLASPVEATRNAARSTLPPRLRRETPAIVQRLALHIGGICRETPIRTTSRFDVLHLPTPDLGSVVATGGAMLRDWPEGPREWLGARIEALRSDRERYEDLRNRLRRAAQPKTESEEQVALMLETIPDLTMHYSRMFSGEGRRYNGVEVCRVLGTHTQNLSALRDWKELKFSALPGGGRALVQYDADQIDALAPLFRGCMPINGCPAALRIPLYGVEQLCCLGLLELEDHPTVMATRSWVPVRRASLDRLRDDLRSAARTGRAPSGLTTLRKAARRLGGGPKPWAALFLALLDGTLKFWLRGDKPLNADTMVVRPADLRAFDGATFERSAHSGFPFHTGISQIDAAELMNTTPYNVQPSAGALCMKFEVDAEDATGNMETALAVARAVAFSGEVAMHLGIPQKAVAARMRALGIPEISFGWPRSALIDRGLLPMLRE